MFQMIQRQADHDHVMLAEPSRQRLSQHGNLVAQSPAGQFSQPLGVAFTADQGPQNHAGALAMASLSAMLRTSPKKWPTRSRSAAMPSGRTATDRPTSAVVVTVISAGRSGIGDPLGRTSVQDSPWGCAVRGSTRVPARLSPALGFG